MMFLLALIAVRGQDAAPRTRAVLLGTGTPAMDPDRSGAATAIVVDDAAYLVDIGPGVVRRAAKRLPAVRPENLKTVFVTHLHSDHTVGYPDLIFGSSRERTRSTLTDRRD